MKRFIFFLFFIPLGLFAQPYGITSGNGSGSSSGNSIDTRIEVLNNYDELRAYQGVLDLVYVKDFTYTFQDSTHTTLGGLFFKSVGSENGGTILVGNYTWERDWDGITIMPEWWEVGGYDQFGISYDSFQTGNGIVYDSDRINAALAISPHLVLQNRTYTIDETIRVPKNFILDGNYAEWIRADVKSANIVTVLSLSSFIVDDISPFRVGASIFVSNGTPDFTGSKSAGRNITNIVGNTIFLDGNLSIAAIPGDNAYPEIILMKITGNTTVDSRNYTINQLRFNGNKKNNGHTVDWDIQYTGLLGANTTFNQCEFYEIPTENIIAPDVLFNKCRFQDLNGSAHHISGKVEFNDDLVGGQSVFFDCVGDGFNLGTQAAMQHSEGLIVFSAIPEAIKISKCRFTRGSEGILGNIGGRSNYVLIENSRFENFNYICSYSATSNALVEDVHFSNNVFKQCGSITLGYGRNIDNIQRDSAGYRNVRIINNEFNNSQSIFSSIVNLKIEDNEFFIQDDDVVVRDASVAAVITITNCDQVKIAGNTLEGFSTYNSNLVGGIVFNMRNTDNQNADDTYHWSTNVDISDNYFTNFHRSIALDFSVPPLFTKPVHGWRINNNEIYMLGDPNNANERYGIQVPPNARAMFNKVTSQGIFVGSRTIPILAMGIDDSGNTTDYTGSVVTNNIVIGDTFESIRIGGRNTGDNEFNVTVVGNVTSKTIVASGTGTDIIENNVVVPLPANYIHTQIRSERSDITDY